MGLGTVLSLLKGVFTLAGAVKEFFRWLTGRQHREAGRQEERARAAAARDQARADADGVFRQVEGEGADLSKDL